MKHQLINHHLLLALSVLLLPSVLMYSANALPQEQSVTQAVYKEIAEREYDFIIVGAGTSGCVLAERLSRCKEFSVLLIDGGFDHEKAWEKEFQKPLQFDAQHARACSIGTYFDAYVRLAQGKSAPVRGVLSKFGFSEVLGGLSALNDQIVARGAADSWNGMGNDLEWESVLPYFKKIEDAQLSFTSSSRGINGPLLVKNKPSKDVLEQFKKTISLALKQSWIQDYNAGDPTGLSEAQYAVTEFGPSSSPVYGKRETTYERFLVHNQAIKRSNLSIIEGHKVAKIKVETVDAHKRATGVVIQTSKGLKTLRAKKEIILTAGALNTPVILLHSGIGSFQTLHSVGIAQVADVPGVGKNLHDHLFLGNVLLSDKTVYPAGYRPPQLLAHLNSQINPVAPTATPDIEYVFTPSVPDENGKVNWLVDIYITRHSLRGQLALTSKVPGLQPAFPVSPHLPYEQGSADFLATIKPVLITAVRFLEPLLDSPLLSYLPRRIGDDFKQIALVKKQTDEQILDQFRHFFRTATLENLNAFGASLFVANRYGGTCKIGDLSDPQTVVDKDFKVRGFANLRVADASILPLPIQSHMDVPCMMLGAKLGAKLCKEYQTTYDFIIVGSGCAGTVLLSRLSEDPKVSVLCVDAGSYYQSFDDAAQKINGRTIDNIIPPQAIVDHLGGWQRYQPSQFGFGLTMPKHAYNNRIRTCNIFGGGSTINCSDYWRGCSWTFDYWASKKGLNLAGWSWDEVAPLHEKVEYAVSAPLQKIPGSSSLIPLDHLEWPGRGNAGRIVLEVCQSPETDPSQPSVAQQIAAAAGLPFFKDYQVPHYDAQGNLIMQFVSLKQRNRTRIVTGYCNDLDAFSRENLTIKYKSPVARILFDEQKMKNELVARAVMTNDGEIYYARKEIIVNCGALISPKLLMLSGIGNEADLRALGIQPLLNLPGVGKNLADHISPTLESFTTTMLSNYGTELAQQIKVILKSHEGTLNGWPDIEMVVAPKYDPELGTSWVNMWTYGHLTPVYGEVRLRSADPEIDVDILGVHEVFNADGTIRSDSAPLWIGLYKAWFKIFKNLKGTIGNRVNHYSQTTYFVRDSDGKVKENPTDEEIMESYRKALTTMPSLFRYKSVLDKGHFMGTCRMGNKDIDPHAVVDNTFKVYGTRNLRIIDNSIIPSTPDGKTVVSPFGHPAGWLYMFGEKISMHLKEKYGLTS